MDLPFSLDVAHLTPFLSALVVAVPVGWLAIRGRSFFPLRYRLWRLMHRKGDMDAEWLDGPIRERMELMKCRALVMWADSYPQARRLEKWAAERGVDLGTLGECGKHFDREKLSLRANLPQQSRFRKVSLMIVYISSLFITFGVILVSKDEAMMSLKINGHWLDVSKVAAHPLSSPRYSAMTLADCAKGDDPAGFKEDKAAVCEILRDPHLSAFIDREVFSEHVAGSTLCALGFILLLLLYRKTIELRSAHAVNDQLAHNARGEVDRHSIC